MAQKAILKPSRGRKPGGDNKKLLEHFQDLSPFKLEDGLHLSTILEYVSTEMITAIENNIKMHFFDYIRRYVNSYFRIKYKEQMSDKVFKKQLTKKLRVLKNDIINATNNSEGEFLDWLHEYKNFLVPGEYTKSYHYDIHIEPQKYLKNMIWINTELENIESKQFHFIPLRTSIVPCSIPIDTKTLIELFVDGKKPYLDNLEHHKHEVWENLFSIPIHMNGFRFDYTIITDGFSASVRFVKDEKAIEIDDKKSKMRLGRSELKGLNDEEKKLLRDKKGLLRKQIADERKRERERNSNETNKERIKYVDFMYIDEVDKSELRGDCVYIDPGKRSIFYMMDDNGVKLNYTNKRVIHDTKRLKYQRLIKNYKDKLGITKIENSLSDYNSKTCNLNEFENYIAQKTKINSLLFDKYSDIKFRQYRWYGYINRKRCEDNMLNLMERTYGRDKLFILGDASLGKQMRGMLSTPNIRLSRRLKERFKVFHIDEFRTSCLHYRTEERCKNLYYIDEIKRDRLRLQLTELLKFKRTESNTKKMDYIESYLNSSTVTSRKLHSVLTYKMENSRLGCINRDNNAVNNIKKLFTYYIDEDDRPLRYRRGYKLEE